MNAGIKQAWELYRDRNVVVGKYRDEIDEMRQLAREWDDAGEPLE